MWQNNQVAHVLESKKRSCDVLISESVLFEDLLLSDKVLTGLHKAGFFKPSPIQLKAIPLGRCGLDLIVQAKSGTGKTCVFSVIALDAINTKSNSLQVVVLAPTREIALQIHGVISCIGQDLNGLSAQVFIGGTLVSEDRIKAKKCHIAIGSPGRLKQLLELGILDTSNVRMFVLDEADKLVEEGSFQKQINWIYSSLPTSKQMLALSATYPEELAEFLTRYMRQPTFVRLNAAHPSLLGLRQYYFEVKQCALPHLLFEEKTKHVISLLSNVAFQQVLVFSNYHSRAESICEALNGNGWSSTFISGNMEQSRRTEAINSLKEFKCRVLVSTDLTSRGIDAHNVNMVINMDIPIEWETYLHRIGRAGRYGSRGIAVSLVSAGEEKKKLLTLAAECNAIILPLSDIGKELSLHDEESNPIITRNETKPAPEKNPSPSLMKAIDPGENLDSVSETSDSESASSSRSTSSRSETVVAQAPDDDFLIRVIRENADAPLIPSLIELQSKVEHQRANRHYSRMSYADLESDFEHFSRTGQFRKPCSDVEKIEAKLDNIDLHRDDERDEVLETPETEHFQESRMSSNTTNGLETQHNALSVTDDREEKLTPELPSAVQTEAKSASAPSVYERVELKSSPVNTLTKSSNSSQRVKPKAASDKNRMRTSRQRHPQSAAAGLDFLKHWTEVEKSYPSSKSKQQTHSPSTNKDSHPIECSKDSHPNELSKNSHPINRSKNSHPIECSKPDYLQTSFKALDRSPLSYIRRNSSALSSDNHSQFTSQSDWDSTSSESNDSSSEACLEESENDFNILAPPALFPFGPTGHCFNPYMCSHPSLAAANEAMISHQVYHHALNHARKQIFRY